MINKTTLDQRTLWRYVFALVCIVTGVILSQLKIGANFLGFSSVGTWLLYVGFVMVAVITLQIKSNKKRVVDERMIQLGSKAGRITFIGIILFAFIVMIIDGISPITIAYSYFMSYLVCGIIVIYLIAYKVLLKYG